MTESSFIPSSLKEKIYFRAKRWYMTLKAYLSDPHYKTLAHSGLFDTRYYLENDPSLDPRYTDPLIHYLEAGWQEGRKPNALFESGYYREVNPECEGMEPLLYYVNQDWKNGANPTPLFFTSWYAATYPESIRSGKNPLCHYLKKGWKEGKWPNPYMDLSRYIDNHPEIKAKNINPLAHYVDEGFGDPSGPLPLFDAEFYLEDNPSSEKLAMSPLAHYVQYGAREGRTPNRFFNPQFYMEKYPEADSDLLTAFLHYNSTDWRQSYCPNRLFDAAFYAERYPEFSRTHIHPLLHYQQTGVYKGYYSCRKMAGLERKPVISIVTPVYNTDELLLRRCINSVLFQAYPHWELCLADDGSEKRHVRKILEEYEQLDNRIKVRFLDRNKGISEASNEAASLATGEFVGFLDHDDELTQDALFEVVLAVNTVEPDIIYTDEDLVNLESRHLDSFFKPGFNNELLLTHNYITHLLVTRRDLFVTVGGFSSECEGAQDFDLVLKLTEKAGEIHHIPWQLYHWRASDTSTSINHTQKTYADAAGKKALQTALARRQIDAVVEPGEWKFYYRPRRTIAGKPFISLVVFIDESFISVEKWYSGVKRFLTYEPLDIQIIATDYFSSRDFFENISSSTPVRIHNAADFSSPANMYNRLVRRSEAEHILFVHPGLTPGNPDWMETLLEYSQDKSVGFVTGFMEKENGQNDGESPELAAGGSWRQFRHFFVNASRDINNVYCAQNVQAASVDLCMIKKSLLVEFKGFNEHRFNTFFFDLDCCLTLRKYGYENVYTPHCRMSGKTHMQGMISDRDAERELKELREKWQDVLKKGDPYFNPGKVLTEKNITREQWLRWYAGAPVTAYKAVVIAGCCTPRDQ